MLKNKNNISKLIKRQKELNVSRKKLAKLVGLGSRTVDRLFAGEDVKVSTLKTVSGFLGLNLEGEEVKSVEDIRQERAEKKARYIVSIVQGTSALEKQGTNLTFINSLISESQQEFLTGKYKNSLWHQ